MVEYKAEFNRLMKFTSERIRDSERTKMQKFRYGLNLELQLDVTGCEVTTLGALINKDKATEEVRHKIKAKDEARKGSLGKRSVEPGFFGFRVSFNSIHIKS